MSVKVGVFQFNGCDKCFNETILLQDEKDIELIKIADITTWKPEKLDVAVITGYILPSNSDQLGLISANAEKIIGYGNCTATGGIFGLAYQHGTKISALETMIAESESIKGCLANIETLKAKVGSNDIPKPKTLCESCSRKSTCNFLDETQRQIDPMEEPEMCFNDSGLLCSGYVCSECSEMCVNYGTPCRGCLPAVDRPGFRMLGMFATLMANVEVASEATPTSTTDKLADEDDDVTAAFPDVTGSFFRHTFAYSVMPPGKIPSTGKIPFDVCLGRPLEEIPLILGCIGGVHSVELTTKVIEAYEHGAGMEISEKTKEFRSILLDQEKLLVQAHNQNDVGAYKTAAKKIREIAGNRNLSNLFFGGFKVPIAENDDFAQYKYQPFDMKPGSYSGSGVEYSINDAGVITEISVEGF